MAIQNKTQLKSYFLTGNKPTQQQFAHLIDSMALVTDLPGGSSVVQPIPVDPAITTADIGKLAMLDYDGVIKLYQETPEQIGVAGQWNLSFQSLSSGTNKFLYSDIKRDLEDEASNWLGSSATPAEEAAAFISHFNTEYAEIFTASEGSTDTDVILTQVEKLFVTDPPSFSGENVTVSSVVSPVPFIPASPKRLCIGIIQHVDPINNMAYFDNIYVVQAETAPDIEEVLQQAEENHVMYHLIVMAQLIALPGNNGKVKRFEISGDLFTDPTYVLSVIQNAMYMFIKPHHVTGRYYVMRRLLG